MCIRDSAKIGDTVTLDTESFHGDYVVTGIMDSVNEKEANTCAIILSNAAPVSYTHLHNANKPVKGIKPRRKVGKGRAYRLPQACLLYTSRCV